MLTVSPLEQTQRPVLVVEDEPVLRASMVRGLSKLARVRLYDAGSLRDAKRLAQEHRPVLVVSDLDLPDGSGLEMASALDELGLRVPILFVSAYVTEYRGRLPKRPGIEVYEKPLSLERLRAVVEAHLLVEPESSPFGVIDYVQLAGMGRRSVVIEVRGRAAGNGRIVIRGGEVWFASDERGEGMEAFKRLAFLKDAVVTCRSVERRDSHPRLIQGGCESVLLEAARQYDEAGEALGIDEGELLEEFDAGWERATPQRESATGRSGVIELSELRGGAVDPRAEPTSAGPALRERDASRVDVRELAGARAFEVAYERGVDALLAKDFGRAFDAFTEAHRHAPDDRRVEANLARLRQMGFGT